jgi:hypothetical protein
LHDDDDGPQIDGKLIDSNICKTASHNYSSWPSILINGQNCLKLSFKCVILIIECQING